MTGISKALTDFPRSWCTSSRQSTAPKVPLFLFAPWKGFLVKIPKGKALMVLLVLLPWPNEDDGLKNRSILGFCWLRGPGLVGVPRHCTSAGRCSFPACSHGPCQHSPWAISVLQKKYFWWNTSKFQVIVFILFPMKHSRLLKILWSRVMMICLIFFNPVFPTELSPPTPTLSLAEKSINGHC